MKKKITPSIRGIFALALVAALICGVGLFRVSANEGDVESDSSIGVRTAADSGVETEQALPAAKKASREEILLAGMTQEQKVAQLFIVAPEALYGTKEVTGAKGADTDAGKDSQVAVTVFDEKLQRGMEKYPVGGVLFFKKNLETPDQTKALLKGIQSQLTGETGIPAFLCVDEEGGRVARICKNAAFGVERVPAMGELAKEGDLQPITLAAETIGTYLSELGFNVDFAPDADVITNKDNTAIGDRSFGTDPQLVSDMAWAFASGLHAKGVLAAYKHFPGHGGTEGDSHNGYAYINKTLDELTKAELVPFADGAQKGVDFIMSAHISLPRACTEDVPASLSKEMLTDLLRDQLGYQGLIVTDALNMGAITEEYSSADAARKAFAAGADLLLMPVDFEEAYDAILSDVQTGKISGERLDESVLRIITAKLKLMK